MCCKTLEHSSTHAWSPGQEDAKHGAQRHGPHREAEAGHGWPPSGQRGHHFPASLFSGASGIDLYNLRW